MGMGAGWSAPSAGGAEPEPPIADGGRLETLPSSPEARRVRSKWE